MFAQIYPDFPHATLFLTLSIAFFAVALLLALFARRGPWVDRHLHCRKCRYDLFGHPDVPPACPECGCAMTKPKAVRTGLRKKRPLL